MVKLASLTMGKSFVLTAESVNSGSRRLISDKTSYDAMRAFRSPFVEVHELGFYALTVLIVLHVIVVVVTEIHEGGGITSAMFTGRKILSRPPPDAP